MHAGTDLWMHVPQFAWFPVSTKPVERDIIWCNVMLLMPCSFNQYVYSYVHTNTFLYVWMHGWACVMWNCNAAQLKGMNFCMHLCMRTIIYFIYVSTMCALCIYLWMSLCMRGMHCPAMTRTVKTTKTWMYRCIYDDHIISHNLRIWNAM